MGTLSFEPLISPALWVALALAAAALGLWCGRDRLAAKTLMGLGLVVVLGILLNPTWVRHVRPGQGKPLLNILVDLTQSMNTPDAPGQKTRLAAAGELADALAKECGDEFDVRVEGFADSLTPLGVRDLMTKKGAGQVTDLGMAITGAIQSEQPQGQAIVLLSDGGHNAPGGVGAVLAAARHARGMGAPVFTHTFGQTGGGKDVALRVRWPQEIAFVGQALAIEADVISRGIDGQSISVSLRRSDREIARKTVTLSRAGPQRISFEVKENQPGLYQYELQADAPAGGLMAAGNVDFVQVRVVDQPIRILLLEGKPYWDAKFLMRTLAADPAVELHSVVKLAPQRLLCRTMGRNSPAATQGEQPAAGEPWRIEGDAARILADADNLKNYQIVVLGREAEEFLSDAGVANLRNWVAGSGGALVCYRGSPVTQAKAALADLMPVRWSPGREERFGLQFTAVGEGLHWVGAEDGLAHMPALQTDRREDVRGPLSVVLATGGQGHEPAVSYQPCGSGRVVVIEGQGMWRWAFLPPEEQASAQMYPDLWHGLLRWLVWNSGLWSGQNYFLRDVAQEKLDIAAKPELMKRIAEESGGAVIDGESASQIAALLSQRITQTHPVGLERVSAWDQWWVLAMILGVWLAAWVLPRHSKSAGRISPVSVAGLVLFVAVLGVVVMTQGARINDFLSGYPAFARTLLSVTPGDVSVMRGGATEIRVSAGGAEVDKVDLVLQWPNAEEEILPMYGQGDGTWRASLTDLVSDGEYFVRAGGSRSARYHINVLPVPQLGEVRFVIRPPAYTHLPEYRGELPQGGIAALPGTVVQVMAASDRPLAGGRMEIPGAATQPLLPTVPGAKEVAGEFTVARAGRIRLSVRDEAGRESADVFTAALTLVSDQQPVVRIVEPKTAFAPPDATISVTLAAEDDYGISRLQLFRSLNESAALPLEFPVASQQPTRLTAKAQLPLAAYGLRPGDVIRLYAHVEDNDAAGAKGGDSCDVVIRIISREEFDRKMLTQRQTTTGSRVDPAGDLNFAVPPQYQERVGAYLRRISDEMEQP